MISTLFIAFFVFTWVAFFLYDRILKFQYKNYKKEWEKQNKAGGFLWNPPESPFFSGGFARNIRLLSWTFGNDDWMKSEPNMLKAAFLMRVCIFSSWILCLLLMIFGVALKS